MLGGEARLESRNTCGSIVQQLPEFLEIWRVQNRVPRGPMQFFASVDSCMIKGGKIGMQRLIVTQHAGQRAKAAP